MESEKDEHGQPIIGRLGYSIIATACTGAVLLLLSNFWNAPQQKSDATDERLENTIAALRDDFNGLQRNFAQHKSEIDRAITELQTRVESGTKERFTATDAASLKELLNERDSNTAKDIDRLERRIDKLYEYLRQDELALLHSSQ